jgi:hypothetical protein
MTDSDDDQKAKCSIPPLYVLANFFIQQYYTLHTEKGRRWAD